MDRPIDKTRKLPLAVLAAACLLQAAQTAVAVHWQIAPAVTYPALKLLMIAVPLLAWRWTRRGRREVALLAGLKRTNLLAGLATGLLAAGVILGGYYLVLAGRIDAGGLVAKARSLGLLERYWLMALGISLGNALFEEYYWRAFIFGELSDRLASPAAVAAVGGALFGLHHVFAMGSLFPPAWVALFVLGTMVAGAVWSAMRSAGVAIWDCYLSHVMADLAIMWVGWDMISKAT